MLAERVRRWRLISESIRGYKESLTLPLCKATISTKAVSTVSINEFNQTLCRAGKSRESDYVVESLHHKAAQTRIPHRIPEMSTERTELISSIACKSGTEYLLSDMVSRQ